MSPGAHQDGTAGKANESEQSALAIFARYIDALDRQPRRAESLRMMLVRRNLNVTAARAIGSEDVGNATEAFRRYVRAIEAGKWELTIRPIQDLRRLGIAMEPRRSKILDEAIGASSLGN